MRKATRYLFTTLLMTVVCFLGIANVFAQVAEEPDFKPVADEMIGSGGITWVPKINYARLILTISRPDGTVFQKTFESGSTPFIGLTGIFGDTTKDGSYTYELRVIPFTEQVARGKSAAAVARERRLQGHKALTQAGYFTVREGMIVTPGANEPEIGLSTPQEGLSGTKDQVILDDLIVDGSLCVGMDCVNGESFGFDTIRLKENNLRIRFVDTSSTSSFPSRDWQITVNDSANGGANKFSIDDIDGGRTPFTIEAGAPSHSLYVDDGGRVGFGTSVPVADLHVKSGNTPTLRLEQDGSSGFTPQTWDVAGNEANFFIRDATNGSELPFRIIPGAPSNSIYIASSGKVGLGTTSPSFPLHVKGSSAVTFGIERDGYSIAKITAGTDGVQFGANTAHKVKIVTSNNTTAAVFETNGYVGLGGLEISDQPLKMQGGAYCDGVDWKTGSSRDYKENIENLTAEEAADALEGLTPVKFYYKIKKEDQCVGFIAEDVPELVATKGRKGLSSMDILAVLTKVVQKQQKTIAELKKEIAELKKK